MTSAPPASSLPGFERSLAIVIGINAYSHGVPPLLNAVRDANAVADTLERQGFEVLRFLDEQASQSALSHLLAHHLPSLQPPPDRLLFYFAGHGLAHTDGEHHLSGFLLPADARRDEPSSYWPMDSLRQALAQLRCRHLLLVLDCCFAGAFPHASTRDLRPPQEHAPLFLERFRHFSSRRSFQLLASTAHDELASDKLLAKPSQEALGSSSLHSPFAQALLEALAPSSPADTNLDGLLTATELYTFLRDRLLALLPSHSQQTPSLRHLDRHDGGEFLFLLSGSFPSLPSAALLSKHSNPYLGLRPFSSEHRHLFFGRERLIDSLSQRIQTQPLVLLSGPSGAGKSSLVHAGLVPRLSEHAAWLTPPALRPSSQPLQQFSSWLASLSAHSPPPSALALAEHPHLAADFLRSFLSLNLHSTVLLIVDPLEELVTACLDESLHVSFLRALSSLLHLSHPRLRVLVLQRADFEPHFLSLLVPSALPQELWRDGRFLLPPMNREELRRCIQKPAEASVLFFSSDLIERLLDDVEQMPGALPLLSVALSELFDAYLDSGRADRTFSFEEYLRLGGGIAGALQRRAELIYSGAPLPSSDGQTPARPIGEENLAAFQRTVRNVLLRMVAPEGGELARRRVPRAELDYSQAEVNARVQLVLTALEAERLVVASDEGGPCVEPAHDALLSAWPRLHTWARQAQRELLLLRRISHAASEWLRHPSSSFLWADARLDALALPSSSLRNAKAPLSLPTTSPTGQPLEPLLFNSSESAFLRASASHQRSLRTRRYALALSVALILLVLTGVAWVQAVKANRNAQEAQEQKNLAENNAQEARKQQETAEENARKAENNSQEARRQQALAEENAEKAKQQTLIADTRAREAKKQRNLVLMNARLIQARRLLEEDPTKALLVLKETSQLSKDSPDARLQVTADLGPQAISAVILIGHTSKVTTAVWSPDGSRVLTASKDGTARLWRADGRGKPLVLKGHTGLVTSATFSPDGSRILTASWDGTARLWRADGRGEPMVLNGHTAIVTSATFSPDGSRILTASNDGTARLWHADGRGEPLVLNGHTARVNSATFSPDGSRILTASNDGTARLWRADGRGEPLVLNDHTARVNSATFSPDGSRILTASNDGTARLWRADGLGEPLVLNGHTAIVNSATFSPDGSRILTASDDGTARLWRMGGRGEFLVLNGHTGLVTSATFSPDGSRILTASDDGTARLWRADGDGEPRVLMGHTGSVNSVTFSPAGSRILTASDDGTARLWRADGRGEPLVLNGHTARVTSVTFSPDGSRILTASNDGTARLWRADDLGEPLVLKGHMNAVTSATFSPDGSRILTASWDGTARLWRADGRGEPRVLKGHTSWVTSVTFSPDGSRILTASDDGAARLWHADGRGEPRVLNGHAAWVNSATFSPDSSRILTASDDGTARLWHADFLGEPLVLKGHTDSVFAATFSPDGSRVLTASWDGTARLWRADGRGEPLVLNGHTDWVIATFSPDASRIAIGYLDGAFHVVPIAPTLLLDSFQVATSACLSALDRERLLFESPQEALNAHAQCERSYGRSP